MRSMLKVTVLATTLLTMGACVEDGIDKNDDKSPTPTVRETKSHHDKWKHKTHHMDPAAHAKKLGDKLNLSKDQQTKVEAIFKQDITWPERHKRIQAILTPDQQKKLADLKAKHPHHGKMHGKWDPAKSAKHHADKLKVKLGLTGVQANKLETIFKSKATWEERRKQIHAVLTADQQKKLAALKAKHPHHGKWKHHGKWGNKTIAEKKAAWLQEKLGLTDAQKAGVKAAYMTGTWKQRHAKMKKLLTKDQLDELRRLHKEMKQRHHKGMRHKGMHR